MDQIHEVEAFRSMLIQKGIVSPDGSEIHLVDLLSSDQSAVDHFNSKYLSSPTGWEEKAIRAAYSTLERNSMLSQDLVILTLWGTYLETIRSVDGLSSAFERIRNLGFSTFRRLDYQEMREMVSSVRSNATKTICHLRKDNKSLNAECYLLSGRQHKRNV